MLLGLPASARCSCAFTFVLMSGTFCLGSARSGGCKGFCSNLKRPWSWKCKLATCAGCRTCKLPILGLGGAAPVTCRAAAYSAHRDLYCLDAAHGPLLRANCTGVCETIGWGGGARAQHNQAQSTVPQAPGIPASRRVAVCVFGHPRTFTEPVVHLNVAANVFRPLARVPGVVVDLFAALQLKSETASPNTYVPGAGGEFDAAVGEAEELRIAQILREMPGVTHLEINSTEPVTRCPSAIEAGAARAGPGADEYRRTQHPFMRHAQCLDMILARERETGTQYHNVIRTRPDCIFLKGLETEALAGMLSADPRLSFVTQYFGADPRGRDGRLQSFGKGPTWQVAATPGDHFIVASRSLAGAVLNSSGWVCEQPEVTGAFGVQKWTAERIQAHR